MLTGGKLIAEQIEDWKEDAGQLLTKSQKNMIEEKMLSPLQAAIPNNASPDSSFTILERKDGKRAVILRYDSPRDYMNADEAISEEKEQETETPVNRCVHSEFLGMRRMMIICD